MSHDKQDCLFLVRHGQSMTNTGKEAANEFNILTRKGIKQALRAGEQLEKFRFSSVWCSPLARAMQTCTTLLSAADHDPIQIRQEQSFVERKYGWDRYMKWEELEELMGKDVLRQTDLDVDFEHEMIETQRKVYDRAVAAFKVLVAPDLDTGHVLLVSHFYVQRALQAFIEEGTALAMPDFYPDNAQPVKYSRSRVLRALNRAAPPPANVASEHEKARAELDGWLANPLGRPK